MKILIVSDTHGSLNNLETAISAVSDFDHLIHCGDIEGQEEDIEEMAGCPVTMVRGNNDWDSELPSSQEVTIGKYSFFVTHGHRFGVSFGTEELCEEAKRRGCRVAVYGHIHRPVVDESDSEVTIINPGSLTHPRQENRKPSYAVAEITDGGELLVKIMYVESAKKQPRFRFW